MNAKQVQACIDRITELNLDPADRCLMEELMSKEIPAEPVPSRVYPDGQYTCSRCGYSVTNVLKRETGAFGYIPYIIPDRRCHNCGQLQDWSRTEWCSKMKEEK